jgi:hypothetical protein
MKTPAAKHAAAARPRFWRCTQATVPQDQKDPRVAEDAEISAAVMAQATATGTATDVDQAAAEAADRDRAITASAPGTIRALAADASGCAAATFAQRSSFCSTKNRATDTS